MAETVSLYRRHRPQSFAEVVGQDPVVRTLRNAVEQDKVHHAYLFVGSRGTGKTSMAKILARSLNCVRGPTVDPCGECESCRTIAAGTSLDVIEMDAASNRSVDDIRDLRERVGYAPTAGRWKVYILDEAHMLTKEAWNAFLKTLEEPPPNTAFVLATTEAHKVMPTIVDRCQRFDFQRPSLEQIAEVIHRVAAAEKIEVEEAAVAMVARAAGGSFRDALGTLDQLVAFGGDRVSLDDVLTALGVADIELLFEATDAIAVGDVRAVLAASEKLAASGHDVSQFARDLISHLRQLLVIRATDEIPDSFSVTAAQDDRLREQAAEIGDATLVRAIDTLSAALAAIREGDEARMTVEVALLKIADPTLDPSHDALLHRIERLESQLGGSSSNQEEGRPARPGPAVKKRQEEASVSEPTTTRAQGEPAAPPQPPQPSAAPPQPPEPKADEQTPESPPVDLDRLLRVWPAIIDHVRESGAEVLSHAFESARPTAIEGTVVKVGFPVSATFNKRKAEGKANQAQLAEAIEAILGEKLRPTYVLLDGEEHQDEPAMISEDEVFERLKSEFEAEELEPEAADEAGQEEKAG
ncbi:MAG: polymerase subunit gamma/tau [Solirubrobacterales bacterium]|nr:polymerase subunit gamma/tau [Solirubrobacterales bacterium]MDX6662641.1 polymerase subunit gamma/tau [Solirubrobacterales bacterium]